MGRVDWRPGLSFGYGFDQVRGEPKQRGVEGVGTAPIHAAGQEGDTSFQLVRSASEFNTALSIDAEVDVGFGLFGADAKFGFRESCKVSNQATFCVLRVLAMNAFEQIPDPKLTAEAWDLLAAGNKKRFRERFGDAFVSGQHVGVEFYGVVRIEAEQREQQMEIATKVQASYGPFASGSVDVNSSQAMKSAHHSIEIFTFQKGGSVQVCQDLPQLFTRAQAALDEGRNGRGYPFAVMLDPYEELRLPNDEASFIKIEAARKAVQRLSAHVDAMRRLQNDIDFVVRNQAWFVSPDMARLNAANQQLSAEINKLVDQADICSRDFEACQDYTPAYPELVLPERKAGMVAPPPIPPATDGGALVNPRLKIQAMRNPAFLRMARGG